MGTLRCVEFTATAKRQLTQSEPQFLQVSLQKFPETHDQHRHTLRHCVLELL